MLPRWSAAEMVSRLGLSPHPEGGWYREVLPSDTNLTPWGATNAISPHHVLTYFLLARGEFAPFRRMPCNESWYLYRGGPAEIHHIDQHGSYGMNILARDHGAGFESQIRVARHTWIALRPAPGVPWSLLVCVMPHGVDFAEFQIATREDLSTSYPQHARIISQLTRVS